MTYPKVTEISHRSEWEPEQVAAMHDKIRDPELKAAYLRGAEQAHKIKSIPTVCPKR